MLNVEQTLMIARKQIRYINSMIQLFFICLAVQVVGRGDLTVMRPLQGIWASLDLAVHLGSTIWLISTKVYLAGIVMAATLHPLAMDLEA